DPERGAHGQVLLRPHDPRILPRHLAGAGRADPASPERDAPRLRRAHAGPRDRGALSSADRCGKIGVVPRRASPGRHPLMSTIGTAIPVTLTVLLAAGAACAQRPYREYPTIEHGW